MPSPRCPLWSGVPAAIAFQFHLYRRGEGPSEEVATRDVETSISSGTVRQRIQFPPISPAKDRVFVVRLQLTRAVARDLCVGGNTRRTSARRLDGVG